MYTHLLPKTEEQPAVCLVDPQEPGLNGITSTIYREYSLAACGSASGSGPAYLSQPHWVSLTESVATQPVSLTQAHSVSFSQSDAVSHSYSVSLTVSVLLSLTHSHSGTRSVSLCQSQSVSLTLSQAHSLSHTHTLIQHLSQPHEVRLYKKMHIWGSSLRVITIAILNTRRDFSNLDCMF